MKASACGILVPQPGIESRPSTVKVQGPNHLTTRESPHITFSLFSTISFLVNIKTSGLGGSSLHLAIKILNDCRISLQLYLSGKTQSFCYLQYSFSSAAHSCPSLCNSMGCSTPGFRVHHQLPELAPTHVHWVGDDIQPSIRAFTLICFFKKIINYFWLCWVFVAVHRLSLVAGNRGYSLVAVCRLPIDVASLVGEHRL